MGFEIVDRRKSKLEAEVEAKRLEYVAALEAGDTEKARDVIASVSEKVVPFKKQVHGEKLEWKSIGYVAVFLPMGQAQVLMVRAVGMRTDERTFTADYAVPPVWEEGEDFVSEARKRLDTFKGCACDDSGRCKFHGEVCPGHVGPGRWLEEDMKRLQSLQTRQLPEAVEVFMKAEQARAQNRIVTPGGR